MAGPILCITFVQYLTAFCSQLEETSDVISGRFVGPVVPDNRMKFGDPRLSLSQEIPPEAILCGILDSFFCGNFRPEVLSDVTSGAGIVQVGMDEPAKFDDSSPNGS